MKPPATLEAAAAISVAGLQVHPFLHFDPDGAVDPLTGRSLFKGDPLHSALLELRAGQPVPEAQQVALAAQGFLTPADEDLSHRCLLKYVSLEAHTVCNQSCYFCPVSIAPAPDRATASSARPISA